MSSRRVLLHICCGPCAVWPTKSLRREGWEVHGLWYNPNIHPAREYRMRLNSCRQFAANEQLVLEVAGEYGLREFLGRLWPANAGGSERCDICYAWRLAETARRASEGGYAGFSTTLLVSPYQRHEHIVRIAEDAGRSFGVPLVYADWRPGFRQARAESRAAGLYHQAYCGCLFSEAERFGDKSSK